MGLQEIIRSIDNEIETLQQARAMLTRSGAKRPGRPAKLGKVVSKKKRNLSPEARAKIAEAQKKRWAAAKKAAK